MTEALGPGPQLVRVLADRLVESGWRLDDSVILAAAGTSDRGAERDLHAMPHGCRPSPVRGLSSPSPPPGHRALPMRWPRCAEVEADASSSRRTSCRRGCFRIGCGRAAPSWCPNRWACIRTGETDRQPVQSRAPIRWKARDKRGIHTDPSQRGSAARRAQRSVAPRKHFGEEGGVVSEESLLILWQIGLEVDRIHPADERARTTVHALVGVDVHRPFAFVDAVDGQSWTQDLSTTSTHALPITQVMRSTVWNLSAEVLGQKSSSIEAEQT